MSNRIAAFLAAAHILASASGASAQAAWTGRMLDLPATSQVVQAKTKKKTPAPNYRRAEPRPGDKLVGRVPSRAGSSDPAMSNFLGAMALGVAGGLMGGVGRVSGTGCQVDYTTANPVGCGGTIPSPRETRRGPYKCQGKNGWYTTNTPRSGCYLASMDQPGSRPSDILGRAVGGN